MKLSTAGWVHGFAKTPARNAGYRSGRCLMRANTRHITAGSCGGDVSVGQRGIFPAYAPRSAACDGVGRRQFGEIDAVHPHNCEWNKAHTGLEVEAPNMATSFTAYQLDSCGLWVGAGSEYGIPIVDLRLPGAARYPIGTVLRGNVDHQDLQHLACDQHSDGWSVAAWLSIVVIANRYLGQAGPGPNPWEGLVQVLHDTSTDGRAFVTPFTIESVPPADAVPLQKVYGYKDVTTGEALVVFKHVLAGRQALVDAIVAALPPGAPGTGSGLTLGQVEGAVEAKVGELLEPFRSLLPGA